MFGQDNLFVQDNPVQSVFNLQSISSNYQMIANCPIATPFCPVHIGKKEQVIHVCTEKSCVKQPLICHLCFQDATHKDHSTLSIAQFAEEIANLKYDESIVSFSAKVKQLAADCLNQMQQFKVKVQRQLAKMEASIKNFFDKKQVSINQLSKEIQACIPINWNQSFQRIVQQVNQQRKKYFDKKIIQNSLKSDKFELMVKNKMNSWDNYAKQTSQSLSKCTALFEKEEFQYTWSKTLKHADIQIEEQIIKKTLNNFGTNCCCLGEQEISDELLQPYRWSIQILSMSNWIAIGICREKITNDNGFKYWGWGQKGHGNFIVFNSKQSYSSLRDNRLTDFYGFTSGEIIKLQYNPTTSKLIFLKGNSRYQMDVEKGQTYRPVVYLTAINDQVKLGEW